jgi:hypothetical protein
MDNFICRMRLFFHIINYYKFTVKYNEKLFLIALLIYFIESKANTFKNFID